MPIRLLSLVGFALVLGLLPLQTAADFREDLRFGILNSVEVRDLQQFLADQNVYRGPVTGNYLSLTRAGVLAFQQREGLPAVGIFGPQSRARANLLLSARSTTVRANIEAQIAVLRDQLKELQDRLATIQGRELEPGIIEPHSLVALNCFYRYRPTGILLNVGKGSGVIIRSDGTILTARHVVDLEYSYRVDPESVTENVALNSDFDHCDVGQIPAGEDLPTAQEIRTQNPAIIVSSLPYEARLVYLPTSANLGVSDVESQHLDFALLRITPTGETFPAAKLLSGRLQAGDEVLTYGYPADDWVGASFRTFRLTGAVGKVKALQLGDLRFRDVPLVVNTEMAAQHGRSGSPLFYRGYVAGIVTSHAVGDTLDSFSVSTEAMRPLLKDVLGEL